METVAPAEAQLYPLVHIHKSYTGAMLRHLLPLLLRGQKPRHRLRRHAEAVVSHPDKDFLCSVFILSHFTDDPDLSVIVHPLHAVVNGIFQDGLDHQLHREVVLQCRIHLERYAEGIFIAYLLDVHIVFRVLQLLLQGNDAAPPAQTDAEEAGQLGHHEDRFLVVLAFNHPDDGV